MGAPDRQTSGGFNGIRNPDLCDAGAILYQLSHEATQSGAGQFVGIVFFSVKGLMNEIYVYIEERVIDERIEVILALAEVVSSIPVEATGTFR